MIGGTGGEGGEGKVGPGREGLMALASAGCEMSSSSYTAGFVSRSVVFARYSDFRYLVVWVCIPGLVNGTASATRAPCGQSP